MQNIGSLTSPIPILMYHSISSPPGNAAWPNLYVSAEEFRQQLNWLRRLGFQGRSVRDAMLESREGRSAKIAVITFDDGYTDVYENALPALKEFGFTATCYFVSQCMGSFNVWDEGVFCERKSIMTWAQAAEWAEAGMEVGSHGCNHRAMTSCAFDECDLELAKSKEELEQKLGTRVESFSYPYGDYNAQVAGRVEAAGYDSAVTTRRGRLRSNTDRFRIRRIGVNGGRGQIRFILGVTTNYHNYLERRPD